MGHMVRADTLVLTGAYIDRHTHATHEAETRRVCSYGLGDPANPRCFVRANGSARSHHAKTHVSGGFSIRMRPEHEARPMDGKPHLAMCA